MQESDWSRTFLFSLFKIRKGKVWYSWCQLDLLFELSVYMLQPIQTDSTCSHLWPDWSIWNCLWKQVKVRKCWCALVITREVKQSRHHDWLWLYSEKEREKEREITITDLDIAAVYHMLLVWLLFSVVFFPLLNFFLRWFRFILKLVYGWKACFKMQSRSYCF